MCLSGCNKVCCDWESVEVSGRNRRKVLETFYGNEGQDSRALFGPFTPRDIGRGDIRPFQSVSIWGGTCANQRSPLNQQTTPTNSRPIHHETGRRPRRHERDTLDRMNLRKLLELHSARRFPPYWSLLRRYLVFQIGHQPKQASSLEGIVPRQPRRHGAGKFNRAIGPFVEIRF